MRVPLEVTEHIIDLGSLQPDKDTIVYSTLLAWSLTCRACTARSCFNLFRHVVIRSPIQMARFADLLAERPSLAGTVLEMTIALQTSPYVPFGMPLRKLTALKAVTLGIDWSIYPPSYARSMSCFTSVTRLRLTGTTFHGLPSLRWLLRGFPELQDIVLDSIKFTALRLNGACVDNAGPTFPPTRTLRTMRMEGVCSPLTVLAGLGYTVRAGSLRIIQNEPRHSRQKFVLSCTADAHGPGGPITVYLPLVHIASIYALPDIMPRACSLLRDIMTRYVLVLLWRPEHPLLVDPTSMEKECSRWRARCSRRIISEKLGRIKNIDPNVVQSDASVPLPSRMEVSAIPGSRGSPGYTAYIDIRMTILLRSRKGVEKREATFYTQIAFSSPNALVRQFRVIQMAGQRGCPFTGISHHRSIVMYMSGNL
ncbi:hypothetical protein K466DRAFT_660833 [Polyporus arcularius HHB13444]|uniref:Uncharacterized protein n=1 Tax=Polyporus arcularius HHB13444 TaxID=1314778 RepID=A0A5C3PQ54_9APHY|nr:hypothetical protein K466DRAFT_660833 [Polyporus arcularius HHB13444]